MAEEQVTVKKDVIYLAFFKPGIVGTFLRGGEKFYTLDTI